MTKEALESLLEIYKEILEEEGPFTTMDDKVIKPSKWKNK